MLRHPLRQLGFKSRLHLLSAPARADAAVDRLRAHASFFDSAPGDASLCLFVSWAPTVDCASLRPWRVQTPLTVFAHEHRPSTLRLVILSHPLRQLGFPSRLRLLRPRRAQTLLLAASAHKRPRLLKSAAPPLFGLGRRRHLTAFAQKRRSSTLRPVMLRHPLLHLGSENRLCLLRPRRAQTRLLTVFAHTRRSPNLRLVMLRHPYRQIGSSGRRLLRS